MQGMELLIYGYLPMMVSAQCVQKTTAGCVHQTGFLTMKDRCQKSFQVKNCCEESSWQFNSNGAESSDTYFSQNSFA